jgi:3-isopropylmalate/(R)-2-methylmalate dehydratase large subunit
MVRTSGTDWSFAPAKAIASGLAGPGWRVVATEPHITQLGAWGMAGFAATPIVLHDAWSRSVLPVGLPRLVRVHVNGPVPPSVSATDLVLHMIQDVGFDGYGGAVLEFQGDAVDGMDPFQRAELLGAASMTHCLTALAPLTESSLRTLTRLGAKAVVTAGQLADFRPDDEAVYRELCIINADDVAPVMADPRRGLVRPVAHWSGKTVARVVLGGCLGGDLAALRTLADLVEDDAPAQGVDVVMVPNSAKVHEEANRDGVVRRLEAAGCRVVTPASPGEGPERGAEMTNNPCLAPEGLVAGLPTLAASWSTGRVTAPGGIA